MKNKKKISKCIYLYTLKNVGCNINTYSDKLYQEYHTYAISAVIALYCRFDTVFLIELSE